MKPFQSLSTFRKFLPPVQPTGVPAIDQETKSTGAPNFNHLGYLGLAEGYMKGFRKLMSSHPEAYFQSFAASRKYFRPSSEDFGVQERTSPAMQALLGYCNCVFCGQISRNHMGIFLLLGLPVIVVFGIVELIRGYSRKRAVCAAYDLTMLFMVATIIYLSIVTVVVSPAEYNRYRFEVDSFYVVIFAIMVSKMSGPLLRKGTRPACQSRGWDNQRWRLALVHARPSGRDNLDAANDAPGQIDEHRDHTIQPNR